MTAKSCRLQTTAKGHELHDAIDANSQAAASNCRTVILVAAEFPRAHWCSMHLHIASVDALLDVHNLDNMQLRCDDDPLCVSDNDEQSDFF